MALYTSYGIILFILLLLVLERWSPLSRAKSPLEYRWVCNLGLALTGSITVSLVFSSNIQDIAGDMTTGLLRERQLPLWAESVIVVLLLDAWRYWEHRVFHEVPILWRTHLTHHSDTALDITTTERHHPLEVILVTCTGMLVLFVLGYSAEALAIYVLLATLSSLWGHASLRLPDRMDRVLRKLIVTPAVHAIHHSDLPRETNSNYGTLLTVWDRIFGTYIDPDDAKIPHFGLEYFHQPEDTALGPVLLQPFEYRAKGQPYQPRQESPVVQHMERPVQLGQAWPRALWQLGMCLLLCIAVLWSSVVSLVGVWSVDAYQYAWLVLPMLVYALGWHNRERTLSLQPRSDYLGLILIMPGIALWCGAFLVEIQLGQHLALIIILQGILLCTLGRQTYAALFPFFAMLFMMVPSGDVLQPLLRDLTVRWIEWFALFFDLPHSIEGYMLYIGEHRYVVIDACSGLSFVLMGGFLGYSFGLLLFRSFWKIATSGLVGAALGVLTNALRVWLIVGIDWLQGSQMNMDAHMNLQWLALLASMGTLFYLAVAMADREKTFTAASANRIEQAARSRALAPLLACMLVLGIVGPVRIAADTGPADRNAPGNLAAYYPGSHELEATDTSQRTVLIHFAEQLDAILIQPQGGHGKVLEGAFYPGEPDIWRHAATGRYRDCAAEGCIDFVHKVFRRKASDDERHAVYAYFVGPRVTDSRLDYRLMSGMGRLSGNGETAGALGFRIEGPIPGKSLLALAFQQLHRELGASTLPAATANIPAFEKVMNQSPDHYIATTH